MPRVWRILSIDGGGIRGIIPAIILASIEARTGKPISQLFDLIAGTSTGAILALGLTKPNADGAPEFSAQDICNLYNRDIPRIFRNPQTWWGNLLTPKYRSAAFEEVLKDSLGVSRLKHALSSILIPCYDIEHRLPFVFNSRLAKLKRKADFRIRDVALAASASPTLFSPVRIPRPAAGRYPRLVDGGVFANNPSLLALAEIEKMYPGESKNYFVVSLGTGKSTRPLSEALLSLWGYVRWSRPMLELVLESISESVHEQMQSLLPAIDEQEQYYRLQIDLPEKSKHAIDDASASNMREITRAAKDFCSDSQRTKELDQICTKLLQLNSALALSS